MKRDYYEILGVDKGADEKQIKKAYRALAHRFHPDVNDHDPDTEEKFKEATEAYEILSDPEKRNIYDTYGHDGLRGGGTGGPFGGGGAFTDFGDIFETFFGGDMFSGEGNAGANGVPSGDLYVEVAVTPHPDFDRQGDDIICRQDLTMVQAALGVTMAVPTLDGEEAVHFSPGTQPGEVQVLRARGVPRLRGTGRGDQHILANVMIPRDLDEHQRELLEELDECCGMEHYAEHSEGLFNRLRHLFTG